MSQTKLISLDNLTRYDGKIKQLITTVTPASATPESVASAGSVGISTKYAREDHTHAISVATGDANGQVKIAGQNASVKGFSDKQDKYTSITYAQWQALTPEQQAAKDYYISDYPSSAITAGNVSYNNSSSGMVANNVQSAVDELKSGLTSITTAFNDANIVRIDMDDSTALSFHQMIKQNFTNIQSAVYANGSTLVIGSLNKLSRAVYVGYTFKDLNYGAFIIIEYSENTFTLVRNQNGNWSYKVLGDNMTPFT